MASKRYTDEQKQTIRDRAHTSANLKFAAFGKDDQDNTVWGLIVPQSEGKSVHEASGVCAVTTSRGDTAYVVVESPIEHDGANVFAMQRTAGGKTTTVKVTAWTTRRLFSDRGDRDVTYSFPKSEKTTPAKAESDPIAELFGAPVAGTASKGRTVSSKGKGKSAAKAHPAPTVTPVDDDDLAALLADA